LVSPTLRALINDGSTLEKTIHRAIENNLWLFGSDYALLVSNRTLQSTIDRVFGADLDDPEARRRPDLLLAENFRSRYVLVEFKRPAHPLTWEDKAQAERYRSKLLPHASPMDILVLGGKRIKDLAPEHENGTIRVLAYTEVVARAENELRWLLGTLKDAVEP
jgi:antiviral defense system Shedu protein SduA